MVILEIDQSYNKVVLGGAIIIAVVLDQLKTRLVLQLRAFDDNAFVTSASRIDGHLFRKMLNEVLDQ